MGISNLAIAYNISSTALSAFELLALIQADPILAIIAPSFTAANRICLGCRSTWWVMVAGSALTISVTRILMRAAASANSESFHLYNNS